MPDSLSSLLDVSSTMLITLYARARETQRRDPFSAMRKPWK
jgi:O-methyltransferase involved in polyketide biosynthesis